jgi:hypothetical protein
LFATQRDGVAALKCWCIAAGIRTKQISKFGGGEIVTDALVHGGKFRVSGPWYFALMESDRAESIKSDKV